MAQMSLAQRAGVIAAVVVGLLFAITLVSGVRHKELVVPTNGVTAGGPKDDPAGLSRLSELKARTRLQQWPEERREDGVSGLRTGAVDTPSSANAARRESGERLTREWLSDRAENRDLLQTRRFREGISTLPAAESGVLVQPQGRTWRSVHNVQVAYGGGLYIFGVSFLIALFLAWRGRIPMKEPESGQTVLRFTAFERANHWLTATSFLLMALTGLIILYGQSLIRPWLGADAYAEVARASAWLHVVFAIPFIIGVIVMAVLWTRQNIPERLDWEWLKRGGGFASDVGPNPPARKFNAGQKLVFWAVALGGLVLMLSGFTLLLPFYATGYTGMQVAQVLHAVTGLLLIGVIIGHIYIGTVGMVGAFDAMWSGRVDRNWAREHHSLWFRGAFPKEEARPATPRTVREPAPTLDGATGTFAIGLAAAIVLSLAAFAVYERLAVASAERTAAGNPAVHLDQPGAIEHTRSSELEGKSAER